MEVSQIGKLKPHHWRRSTVFKLLDKCWLENKTTQYEMKKYVKQETGLTPSPKLIVEWKKSRNITLYKHHFHLKRQLQAS